MLQTTSPPAADGGHLSFTDIELFGGPGGPLDASASFPSPKVYLGTFGSVNPARAILINRLYLRAFFDHFLRDSDSDSDSDSSLLDGPSPAFPESFSNSPDPARTDRARPAWTRLDVHHQRLPAAAALLAGLADGNPAREHAGVAGRSSVMLTPDFARLDVEHAAAPGDLARGRELAGQVEDLDRDEFSVGGSLPGERIPVTVPSPAILCNCSRQLPARRA